MHRLAMSLNFITAYHLKIYISGFIMVSAKHKGLNYIYIDGQIGWSEANMSISRGSAYEQKVSQKE